ncbi:glycosyltransferase family 9 protein [Marinicella litoralis]|uniref:Heptosyltransferase I n=1 Tax=Marinicella litoralis TaxID=644220 RepID=A0A4R6XG54_9GAMM|nr:glycosyltransferase family 9 protein [Marinicella litoralis]TDR18365.1 heptosyltransferase I [Marinicella litoralis]
MTTNHHLAPTSICLFRLSAIGDATHVIPVIKTLQNKYPDCPITWLIGKLEYKLLKGLPGVEFIIYDKSAGWSGIQQMRKQLKGRQFDVMLLMQLSFRANFVSWFIKAKRRIGFDNRRAKEGHRLVINEQIPYLQNCHVLDGFMQFAEYLGCDEKIMNWDLPVNVEDQKLADKVLSKSKKNVVISPCSSHELRNWSVAKYGELIQCLVKEYQVNVILTGSPSPKEKAFIASIERASGCAVKNMAGQDTLKQLWCLLKGADLVVSPDSGPLHMAGSVKTPVIGLLAASNYKRSGSYQFPELTVDKYPQACHLFLNKSVNEVKWGTKTEFPGAMDLITIEDVLNAVNRVLVKGK